MLEISNCIQDYINYQKSEKKSVDRTIKKYMIFINEMIEIMDIKSINDIDNLTYPNLRQFWLRKKEDEGLSPSSLNLRISAARSFLGYLEAQRLIKENVANKIKKFKCKPREVEVDLDKIKKMIQLIDDDYYNNPCFKTARDRYLLYMLLFVGARNEECRKLKLDSINIKGEFELIGKYNKSRFVCLPDKMIKMHFEYLTKWRSQVPDNSDYLFTSIHGNMLDKNVPLNLTKKYASLSEMGENFHCHDLRHICVTTLIESGVSVSEVSKIVGHSNTSVTEKNYFRLSDAKTKENINKNKLLEEVM